MMLWIRLSGMTTSGSVIESSIAEASDTSATDESMADPEEGTAESVTEGAAGTPEERMASLGLSQEMDYTCDTPGITAHIVLYGNEEVAAVIIPDKVNVPLYLDCSPTRIGPECSDGQFTAHQYAGRQSHVLRCERCRAADVHHGQPDLPPVPETE
jgi:hypothetical protein